MKLFIPPYFRPLTTVKCLFYELNEQKSYCFFNEYGLYYTNTSHHVWDSYKETIWL